MSLLYPNRYPGRWDPTSADYPQGKFRNRSSPTAKDGSFCEMDWANDWAGFFGALLSNAGVVPNGSIDTAQSSQLFTALQAVILKSLPKRSFAANDFIRIPDVPGGLIVQWGVLQATGSSGSTVVTLPTAFPNGVRAVVATRNGSTWGPDTYWNTEIISNSQVAFRLPPSAAAFATGYYIAIGY